MSDTQSFGEGTFGNSDAEELAYADAEITEQWDKDDEFGELAERMQAFDRVRHDLYDLVGGVMAGTVSLEMGPDDPVQMGMTLSVRAYENVVAKLLEQYADPDERTRIVKSLHMGDEQERLGLFRAMAPQTEFINTEEKYIEATLGEIFRELDSDEEIVECLRNLYGSNIATDLNTISHNFPKPETIEAPETKSERRRRKLLGIAGDIGKMAAAATLAIIITKKFDR